MMMMMKKDLRNLRNFNRQREMFGGCNKQKNSCNML